MFFLDVILQLSFIHYIGLEQCQMKNPRCKDNHNDLWYLYKKTYMFHHSWKARVFAYKLHKSIYWLKLVSHECHLKFNTPSCNPTTSWCNTNACLYTKRAKGGNLLILILFKDDVLTCSPNKGEVGNVGLAKC